jgi:hypothetical protein
MKQISAAQFAIFRIALGLYLAFHFAQLIPYGAELFSNQGMLPDARLNPTFGILPSPLAHWDSPSCVTAFLSGLTLLSLAFTAGAFRRSAAVLIWFGWACLFNRNNLILNPSIPYIGLLLLLSALVSPGEGWALAKKHAGWQLPSSVYWTAWILLAAGYSYSGWTKLQSPSWIDGSALSHILQNPLARPGFTRDALLQWPDLLRRFATWGSLAAELSFLPLIFSLASRQIAWLAMLGLQIAILLVVNFADLTIAMLLVHLFTFDRRWILQRENRACPKRSLALVIGASHKGCVSVAVKRVGAPCAGRART